MSLDAMLWAWDQKLPATLKIILLSLADRADERHRCYPSIARLEHDCGLNRKTIIKNIKLLASEEYGLISAGRREGVVTVYQLLGVESREDRKARKLRESDIDNPIETSTKIGTGTKIGTSTKIGTPTSTKIGTGPVPKLVHEPIKNLPINLPKYIRAQDFEEFLQVRRKLKAVNSEHALKLLLAELEKIKSMGQDPNEAIRRSILNSWKTVYPERVSYAGDQSDHRKQSKYGAYCERTRRAVEQSGPV